MSNAFDKASLVMLPHAYEEGKLYSLKPTDRSGDFTFSRGTDTATRVNASGNIEKETANLLLQSNSFDTTWTKTRLSVTGGQAGYDGSNDAWLFENNQAGSNASLEQSFSSSSILTYSVYAKAGTTNWLNIRTEASGKSVWFDLANGVIGTQKSTTIASKIESVGNDWYRLSIVFDSCTAVRFYVVDGDNSFAVTLGANVYIQDAQINPGLVAYPYLETTTAPVYGGLTDDMPRLDYSGGATCPSLLLEPSRTNLIPYSEYIEGSGWTVLNGITLDANNTTSPEGITNAYEVTATSISHNIYLDKAVSVSTDYTLSFYAKRGSMTDMNYAIYDSTNGSFIVSETSYYSSTSNEWSRIKLNFTTPSNCVNIRVFPLRNSGVTGNVYLWGFQLEEGSYPTSYIPTYGSSQTRAADDINIPSSADLSIPSDSWTILLDISDDSVAAGGRWVNDSLNNMNLYSRAPNKTRFYWRGIGQYISTTGGSKVIARYDGTTATEFHDGVNKGSASYSGQLPFNFRNESQANSGKYLINKIVIFPTALSDDQCIALTTL